MRILVVVYMYPPMASVGANRWSAMAKYLRRLGHDVTVLTTSAYGQLPGPEEHGVVRTADLNAAPALRMLLRRPALARPGEPSAGVEKPAPSLLTRVIVPDAYAVSWTPAALLAARRIVRASRIDAIVTSSPFESTHLVGLGLGRARPVWLADFRDGWGYEDLRTPFPTRAQRALDASLERRVARAADVVVAATPPIAEDLASRFGVPALHVPNAWDPEDDAAATAATPPVLDDADVNVVHTGTLSGGWGRDPRPLLAALARLEQERDTSAPRVRLVLAGRSTEEERRLIEQPELRGLVRHVGQLTRAEAAALQRRADALVLVTSRNRSEATGKLFEYLAAGRPIVALAEGNVAAGVVAETGTGIAVPPDDVAAIVDALRRVAVGEVQAAYAPQGLARYTFPGPAEAIVEQLERAIAARRQRSGA